MADRIYNPVGINYNIPKNVKTSEQKQLYQACVEFEALLTKQILSTMQSSNDIFGKGFGGDYFKSMFQDELAKQIAGNGLGLAKVLYEQIVKAELAKASPGQFSRNGRETEIVGE